MDKENWKIEEMENKEIKGFLTQFVNIFGNLSILCMHDRSALKIMGQLAGGGKECPNRDWSWEEIKNTVDWAVKEIEVKRSAKKKK